MCSIIDNVISAATEVEIVTVYKICQTCVSIRKTLTEMGHPRLPTPVEVDNQWTVGILIDTIK